MITCLGYDRKKKQYVIEESESNLLLCFGGKDAKKFRQHNPPTENVKKVKFTLTVKNFMDDFPGFLPVIQ